MQEFFKDLTTTWWGISLIVIIMVSLWLILSIVLYRQFFKRFYDILLSGLALIILFPILLILIILGAIEMKGNPFFTQKRPGKKEKIFKLIKFRTMNNKKDKDGNLLSDSERLTKYGRFLRSTSLDELPEIWNIFIGQMSIVGPRPLAVVYLPYYNDQEKHRHDVRPGLTGLAQVNGRNAISWDKRFEYDIIYVKKVSLIGDMKIIFLTIKKVLKKEDIAQAELKPIAFHVIRQNQINEQIKKLNKKGEK